MDDAIRIPIMNDDGWCHAESKYISFKISRCSGMRHYEFFDDWLIKVDLWAPHSPDLTSPNFFLWDNWRIGSAMTMRRLWLLYERTSPWKSVRLPLQCCDRSHRMWCSRLWPVFRLMAIISSKCRNFECRKRYIIFCRIHTFSDFSRSFLWYERVGLLFSLIAL